MRAIKTIFLFVCVTMLIVPLLFLDTEANSIAPFENRYKAEFSAKKSEFEAILRDRIGFKKEFVIAYHNLLYSALDYFEFSYYVSGKDQHFFVTAEDNVYGNIDINNNLNKSRAEEIVRFLENVNNLCTSQNAKFLYVNVPEKRKIYSEFLKTEAFPYIFSNLSQDVLELLKNTEIPHLDLTGQILEEKKLSPLIQKF